MHWLDDGIVLGVRKHGEASAILELMTRTHGRHLGLVRGGGSSRLRPVLQGLAVALMLFLIGALGPQGPALFLYFRF